MATGFGNELKDPPEAETPRAVVIINAAAKRMKQVLTKL